jgi:hypothetical protein
LKVVQTSLQKNIIWINMGKQEWKDVSIIARLLSRMFKTPMKVKFASKTILFQITFEYQNVIYLCYEQHALHLSFRVTMVQLGS